MLLTANGLCLLPSLCAIPSWIYVLACVFMLTPLNLFGV